MSLWSGIKYLHPDAVFITDVCIRDKGDGPKIIRWNEAKLGPMPSLDVLEEAGLLAEQEIAAEAQDKSTLREQIIVATEAQWLGLTEAQRQKTVLKALKYLARNF